MKTQFIHQFAFLLGLALLALGFVLDQSIVAQANPSVWYVAPSASCIGTPNCFANVQAAVDAASFGDEIRVAAGTYTDISVRPRNDITTTGVVTQVVYISKTVTIRGGYNASFSVLDPAVNVTILNALNRGRGIYLTGNISPTIESLNVMGGNATGLTGYYYVGTYDVGGGVYVMTATATLNNNRIFSNTAPYGGGGVFLGKSAGQLNGNTIFSNTVNSGGGGVFLYQGSSTLTSNQIISNTSHNLGGGAYLFSTNAKLNNNTISGNTTIMYGGGVDVASCSPTFNGNLISRNTANQGGGLYLWYSRSVLTNNALIDNQATTSGSGLQIGGSQPYLLHTTIGRNTGGGGIGVFATSDGATAFSTPIMTNTILVSQTTGISVTAGSVVTVTGVLWFGNGANAGGAGTVNVSNAFTGNSAFAADGYHLTSGSAAIDKGVNAGITIDIDGQPRVGIPDLGADEYWVPGFPKYIYLPLIMRSP